MMRRSDREITDPQEITDIMSRCEILHLGIQSPRAPYVLPVNFGMEEDGMVLYVHGASSGTKYELISQNPCVGIEMECQTGIFLNDENHSCSYHYESVMGWGYAQELTEDSDKRHALKRIMAQYHKEDFPFDTAPIPRTRILKIVLEERTAKRRRKK